LQIEIAIIGFNRSLSTTWPLILKNVIEPLEASHNTVILNGVISHTKEIIISKWSEEYDFGEILIPESYKYTNLIQLEQQEVDNQIQGIYRDFLKKRLFNLGLPEDEEIWSLALLNLLRYLYLQSKYCEVIEEGTDFIIFIRPDLLPIDKLYCKKYLQQNKSILMPTWGKHGGHNDRFAIVPKYLANSYFNRFHRLFEYSKNSNQLISEHFLKWSLEDVPTQEIVVERMARIRAGGLVKRKEDFQIPHKYDKGQSMFKSLFYELIFRATNYKRRYIHRPLVKFDLLNPFQR
jgi:hypothetical protein